MHKVPAHKSRVAISKVIIKTCALAVYLVPITRSGPRFANPTGISIWRDHEANVLQAIQNVLGTVLYAIFVARNECAAYFSIKLVLPLLIQFARMSIQPFNNLLGDRTVIAQPNRTRNDQNICF